MDVFYPDLKADLEAIHKAAGEADLEARDIFAPDLEAVDVFAPDLEADIKSIHEAATETDLDARDVFAPDLKARDVFLLILKLWMIMRLDPRRRL